jgi:hypothetical protein
MLETAKYFIEAYWKLELKKRPQLTSFLNEKCGVRFFTIDAIDAVLATVFRSVLIYLIDRILNHFSFQTLLCCSLLLLQIPDNGHPPPPERYQQEEQRLRRRRLCLCRRPQRRLCERHRKRRARFQNDENKGFLATTATVVPSRF